VDAYFQQCKFVHLQHSQCTDDVGNATMSSIDLFAASDADSSVSPAHDCYLFDGLGCQGQSINFAGSDSNFAYTSPEWNDRARSMQCFAEFPPGTKSKKPVDVAKREAQLIQSEDFTVSLCRVLNYEECYTQALDNGACLSNHWQWEPVVSFGMSGDSHTCVLFDEENCGGQHITLDGSIPDLNTWGWSDLTKSVQCTQNPSKRATVDEKSITVAKRDDMDPRSVYFCTEINYKKCAIEAVLIDGTCVTPPDEFLPVKSFMMHGGPSYMPSLQIKRLHWRIRYAEGVECGFGGEEMEWSH
jgi:hypothetical protein